MARGILGAQLYSVRQSLKNLDDIATSLEKIARIGYRSVQLSGLGPVDKQELAKVIKDSGLIVASTHESWDRFRTDLDNLIAEHKFLGCRHPAIGGLNKEYHSLEGINKFASELRPVAERLASEGMDFSYHNHNHELTKYDGITWLERLYSALDPRDLKAEIDTFWIQAGGGDPADWIARLGPRQPILHLKDMVFCESRQRFAPVGEGNLNWPAILKAARKARVEYYMVEQDETYGMDPFEAMAISYRNCRKMGLS